MPLTDIECKKATCPEGKLRARFTDAGGLYLEVAPNGSRRWFWKYLFAGKEKRLALGSYPDTSLKAARDARDASRRLQKGGVDPAQKRQADKLRNTEDSGNSFEAIAREFHRTKASSWSGTYGQRWIERMEKDAFPWIGSLPVDQIDAPMLLQTLRRVEARGAH